MYKGSERYPKPFHLLLILEDFGDIASKAIEVNEMPKVISFANMKGGVGKTTLCVNLAFQVFTGGEKILVIDNDPQFNASTSLLRPEKYIDKFIKSDRYATVYDIYEAPPRIRGRKSQKIDPKSFFLTTWYLTSNPDISLDIISSRIELYDTLSNPSHKEYLLDKFIEKYANEYEYIFIDCPPTPSVLTLSGFAASDYVLIPVTPDFYSTMGLPQFIGTLKDFKSRMHDTHDVKPLGVVFTNVPRVISPDVKRSMKRVRETLADLASDIEVFESRMSHLKVYQKSLWQSVPVQKVAGRGIRGKSLAAIDLFKIEAEMKDMIQYMEGS